jgi:4-alpha-glucanotransferase
VPGYKVIIWEKDQVWDEAEKKLHDVFRDPAEFPALSVSCFGTHDTAPVAAWWEDLGAEERAAVTALPELQGRAKDLRPTFTPAVHEALVSLLSGSGSDLVLFLLQDLLGTKERINTPATVGAHNWTYRLPAVVDDLRADPGVFKLTEMVRRALEKSGR